MINSAFYWSNEIFEREKFSLTNSWIYVGLTTDIPNHHDYGTFELFGKSYFYQNIQHKIVVFENKCIHRFSKIFNEPSGNKSMTCQYHGWTYDSDGNLLNKNIDVKCNKLTAVKFEICGKFIFVSLGNSDVNLQTYLGDFYSMLVNFSNLFDKCQSNTDVLHDCNWKLMIENVLECYHCSTVHKNTFIPMGIGREKMINYKNFDGHSFCEYPKSDVQISKNEKFINGFLEDRVLKHNSYSHCFIFPNLLFSSSEGKSFYVGKIEMLEPTKTNLNIKLFSPKFNNPITVNQNMVDSIADFSKNSTLNVINEDLTILNSQQSNINGQIEEQMYLEDEEIRIIDFLTYYKHFLNDK